MIKPLAPQAFNSILESLSSDGVQRFVHKKQKITLCFNLPTKWQTLLRMKCAVLCSKRQYKQHDGEKWLYP